MTSSSGANKQNPWLPEQELFLTQECQQPDVTRLLRQTMRIMLLNAAAYGMHPHRWALKHTRLSPKRKQGAQWSQFQSSVCTTSLLPFVDGLLILLVGFDKPLADTNKGSVHEAALQQVMDGFEEQRSALVGQAALPRTVLITLRHRGHISTLLYPHAQLLLA